MPTYTFALAPAPAVDAKVQVELQVIISRQPVGAELGRLFQIASGLGHVWSYVVHANSQRKPLLSTAMVAVGFWRVEVTLHVVPPDALKTAKPITIGGLPITPGI